MHRKVKNDYFASLPDELLIRIMHNLVPHHIDILGAVNRLLHSLSQDEKLWRHKFKLHFPKYTINKQSNARWYDYFIKTFQYTYKDLTPKQKHLITLINEQEIFYIEECFERHKSKPKDLKWQANAIGKNLVNPIVTDAIIYTPKLLAYIVKLAKFNLKIESLPYDISFDTLTILHHHELRLMTKACCTQFYKLAVARGHIEIIKDFLSRDHSSVIENQPLIVQAAQNRQLDVIKLLHETYDHDLNEMKFRLSALFAAASVGDVSCIEYLIIYGADLNIRCNGRSPFYIACENGHLEAAKILLPYYDVNAEAINGSTPLYIAAQTGKAAIVNFLLQNHAVKKSFNSYTPLYIAASNGHLQVVKILATPTTVNEVADDNDTPLYMAALKGHTECVEVLLQQGADAKILYKHAYSPLYAAANTGHAEIVTLLASHSNINAVVEDNVTALYVAAQEGHTDCVKILLKCGADPFILCQQRYSAWFVAAQNGHAAIVELLATYFDINAVAPNNTTALYIAAQKNHSACIEILLKLNAKISILHQNNYSPLYIAAQKGHVGTVKLLAPLGMVNHATLKGATALYIAARNGHLGVMQVLLQYQADINSRFQNGFAAIHIAAKHRQIAAVKVLLKHGASVLCPNGQVIEVSTSPEIQLLLTLKLQTERLQVMLRRRLTAQSLFTDTKALQKKLAIMQQVLTDLLDNKVSVNVKHAKGIHKHIKDLISKYNKAAKKQMVKKS